MCFQSSVTGSVQKSEYIFFVPPLAIFKNTLYYYLKDKGGNWGCERGPIVASSFLRPVQLPQMTGGTLGGACLDTNTNTIENTNRNRQTNTPPSDQSGTPPNDRGTLGGASAQIQIQI